MSKSNTPPRQCPCGLDKSYSTCCGRFHKGALTAPTAELLMRSRYAAFVLEDKEYLLRTWAKEHQPDDLQLDSTNWLGLKVKKTKLGSECDTEGWVEFVARYKVDGKAERIEELSYFQKEDGQWLYFYAEQ